MSPLERKILVKGVSLKKMSKRRPTIGEISEGSASRWRHR